MGGGVEDEDEDDELGDTLSGTRMGPKRGTQRCAPKRISSRKKNGSRERERVRRFKDAPTPSNGL
eukprot:scaffold347193_cov55-Attheya_sp.AAC.2